MLTIRKRPVVATFDRRGYYRSPVTLAAYRKGKPAPNKGRRFPPEPLTRGEIHGIMAEMGRGAAGRRDRALMVVLWRGALRIAEALALYPKDIDLEAGTIAVLHGKGDRRRMVGIDPEAAAVIAEWLKWRYRIGLTRRHAVFCVITRGRSFGQPVYASVFREKLKDAAARAGIEKRITPHQLRHTCASEMAREQIDILSIQDHLGHSQPSTTFRYIHRLNPWQSIETAQRRTWAREGVGAELGLPERKADGEAPQTKAAPSPEAPDPPHPR